MISIGTEITPYLFSALFSSPKGYLVVRNFSILNLQFDCDWFIPIMRNALRRLSSVTHIDPLSTISKRLLMSFFQRFR